MAIERKDCLILLNEMEEKGFNTSYAKKLLLTESPPIVDIIRYINKNRQLDISKFYEKIRKSYNNKKSTLYINIVREIKEPYEVIITLSALLTQILLFSKNVEDKDAFLKYSRANEITYVLSNYFRTGDLTKAMKLLKLIKLDLKVLESSL